MSDYQYQQPYAAPQAYPAQQAYPSGADAGYLMQLEQRVRYLEAKCATALVSGGFFKKSFAVWGYAFVASFIIGTILSIIGFIIALIFGITAAGALGEILRQSSGSTF